MTKAIFWACYMQVSMHTYIQSYMQILLVASWFFHLWAFCLSFAKLLLWYNVLCIFKCLISFFSALNSCLAKFIKSSANESSKTQPWWNNWSDHLINWPEIVLVCHCHVKFCPHIFFAAVFKQVSENLRIFQGTVSLPLTSFTKCLYERKLENFYHSASLYHIKKSMCNLH